MNQKWSIRSKQWVQIGLIQIFTLNIIIHKTNGLRLLSDLPTPSFLLDLTSFPKNSPTPALSLPQQRVTLYPLQTNLEDDDNDNSYSMVDYDAPPLDLSFFNDRSDSYTPFFLHASVIRSKKEFVKGRDESQEKFLAELDLPPSLTGHKRVPSSSSNENSIVPSATLCLGLNNHHVGGYYWARSAGSGASMEAPGVVYTETDFYQDGMMDDKGILQWSNTNRKEGSSISDNTNDGKRSEWVNFLRVGDTVQLVPTDESACLLKFIEKYDYYGEGGKSVRIFGVSFQGRPMGSDPEVVCEWRCG